MASDGEREKKVEIEDCPQAATIRNVVGDVQMPFHSQTYESEKSFMWKMKNKFLDMIKCHPIRSGYKKFRSTSVSFTSSKFTQFALGINQTSQSTQAQVQGSGDPSDASNKSRIDWASLRHMSKEWIKNPMNMALLVWIIGVGVSGAILFMVMTGMLNRALPKKSQRDTWFEVNNQIINALFTLMCLYQHPKRFHHLALILRWKEKDILRLRTIYSKNGTYKPHERFHMMVVVVLLHINCFAQYALCGLNLGYSRSRRPAIGVALCLSVSIASPAVSTVYNILSPLGKEYEMEVDQEAQEADKTSVTRVKSLEKKFSFAAREVGRVPESSPKWKGGLFDLWDDISVAYLSFFCSFCVFGWNMDRLGFGNMYVHIATFILLCISPFWIFNLAAINIDNEVVREALGFTGIILCLFGLFYGGFWRIQMRRKFNLPENRVCCGSPSMTDCFQWLCCCACSLAQEVRTADFYEIVEDKFFKKQMSESSTGVVSLPHGSPLHNGGSPLPNDASPLFRSGPSSPLWASSSPTIFRFVNPPSTIILSKVPDGDIKLPVVKEEDSSRGCEDEAIMVPPHPSKIQRDDDVAS